MRTASPATTIAAFFVLGAGSLFHAWQAETSKSQWRTAWGTAQQALGTTAFTNTTVRLIARVTIGGEAVRIRLDNTYGKAPLTIRKAYVGLRTRGAALVSASNQRILFGGAESVTVPPGGSVKSDAVALHVIPRQDLAVSLYVPDANVQPSQHTGALVTSFLAAANAGDQTSSESGEPFTSTTTTMPWLKAIDVLSSSASGVRPRTRPSRPACGP